MGRLQSLEERAMVNAVEGCISFKKRHHRPNVRIQRQKNVSENFKYCRLRRVFALYAD